MDEAGRVPDCDARSCLGACPGRRRDSWLVWQNGMTVASHLRGDSLSVLIVGSGVVGNATGVGLQQLGHAVTFVDVCEERLAELTQRGLRAVHVTDMTLDGVTAVFVAVPTPSSQKGIDYSHLDAACESVGSALRTAVGTPLVVFRSTIPPGTTRNRLVPRLEGASERVAGRDFHVAYNPEYLRAWNAVDDFLGFKFVTIGTSSRSDVANQRLRDVFQGFEWNFTDLTYEEAEFQKYVHNLYNATKISFFNEMRQAAETIGIGDVEATFQLTATTAESMWNPQYGLRDFGPFGGACLPKDTSAWVAYAQENNIPAQMVRAAREVNTSQQGQSS
jgi:UDPglucose 6-dehydrogenase